MSMMLQAGESVMWVAQQMGHTDWTFTARIYSRWVSIDAPEAEMDYLVLGSYLLEKEAQSRFDDDENWREIYQFD
jgi:hypothetical protein